MTQTEEQLYTYISTKLETYDEYALPGINTGASRHCLIRQLVDSIKRIKYLKLIAERESTIEATNYMNTGFNPMLASVYHRQNDNLDEAFWLIFLATHFGKHKEYGWSLLRSVYSRLHSAYPWSWNQVCIDVEGFRVWLHENEQELKDSGKFSNHRKYQSLSGLSQRGTGATVETYIDWIGENNSHVEFINQAITNVGNDPKILFGHLYKSMSQVMGFDRLGKFDFLTNIGKLGLVNIQPNSPYIAKATGPKNGARILFGVDTSNSDFEKMFDSLDKHFQLEFGMQVLEDAFCNWQKDINNYTHFKG